MSRYLRHVFICTNDRPAEGRPSCASRNSSEIYARFQLRIAQDPDLVGNVAVTPTGCLGPCFDGPNVVIYPEGVWYANVAPDDVDEIVTAHLTGDQPVDRLVYQWPDDDD